MSTFSVVPFDERHTEGISLLASAEGWPTFSHEERVRRLFRAPGVVGLVASRGEAVVGAAHLLTDGHHGYLTSLVVAASERRTGIGKALLTALFAASGAERIDLLSTDDAAAFYRNCPHQEFAGFRMHPATATGPSD